MPRFRLGFGFVILAALSVNDIVTEVNKRRKNPPLTDRIALYRTKIPLTKRLQFFAPGVSARSIPLNAFKPAHPN
jgi:hypothetical protein